MPNRMILEGRALVRYLVMRVELSGMGSVFLPKRPYRSPTPLLPCEDTRRKHMLFIRERPLTRT